MDLLHLMTQANANNNLTDSNDALKQYTNKEFLIEIHKRGIESIENFVAKQNFQQTVTPDIKSLATVPLHPKNRIELKDLIKSANEPIIGKYLLCRSICPPCKMTALSTIVDDPDGKLGARISLYNFVPDSSVQHSKDVYQYLPVGSVLAIMNPWFKRTTDGGFGVRCDNPAHVIVLNPSTFNEIFGDLTWNGQIPNEYQRKELLAADASISGSKWKVVGNEHFVSKRYNDAITAYTNGIEKETSTGKDRLDLLANRSAAYLGLSKYILALTDAESVLDIDKTHMKCLFRKAKALFGMALYQNAVTCLSEVSIDTIPKPQRKIISDLILKGKSLLVQSQTGDYPWKEICKDGLDNHDLAEFKSTFFVKDTPKKGRGLFASETIKAGQLILASKAFACVVDKDPNIFLNMNFNKKLLHDRAQTQLVTNIAHTLKENPEKCQEVYNLYAGTEFSNGKATESLDFQVDMSRIEAICRYNSFGVVGFGSVKVEQGVSGLWITPSFINHSCVDGNSFWTRSGDFLFVRAFHDIPKDHEILISYTPPFGPMPQTKLEKYNFVCDCRLCVRDRQDNSTIQATRAELMSQLDAILKKYETQNTQTPLPRQVLDAEVTNILKSLKDSRMDAPELNICFMDKMYSLALVYYKGGCYLKSANILDNIYKAVANIPGLCYFTLNTCNNLIGSLLMAGKTTTAKRWIQVLQEKTILCYGAWDVIEVIFPLTVKLMDDFGLYIR